MVDIDDLTNKYVLLAILIGVPILMMINYFFIQKKTLKNLIFMLINKGLYYILFIAVAFLAYRELKKKVNN